MFFILVMLLLVLSGIAWISYRRTVPPISPRVRTLLVSLRITAYVLIAVLFLDPRCAREGETRDTAIVAVAVDRSQSMQLPAGDHEPEGKDRFDAALALAGRIDSSVTARGGSVRRFYFADDLVPAGADTVTPGGLATDIIGSLHALHEKLEGENCTAVVLITDGVETSPSLLVRDLPPLRIFTIGLGDTVPPQDVRMGAVAYSPIVRVPSRQVLRTTLINSGPESRRVRVRLMEQDVVVTERDVTVAAGGGATSVELPVDLTQPGRTAFRVEMMVEGPDAEPGNNMREVVIDAEKAEVSVLVVDQLPAWEHAFLTGLLKRQEMISFDVIGPRGRTDRDGFIDPDRFAAVLGDYDVLVLSTLDGGFIGPQEAAAIDRFVTDLGKGMLVLPGSESLFERTAGWNRLEPILPVTGTPPCRFIFAYTEVVPGEQAALNAATADLMPLLSRTEWQERNPLLGYHSTLARKPGAEELLVTRKQRMPALVYGTAGSGRVALVGAGPLWRWKFLPGEGGVYDQLLLRLLDLLARGDDTNRFSLIAKKRLFEAGEPIDLFAELFDAKMQPVTGVPVRLEIARIDSSGRDVPLRGVQMKRAGADDSRYTATIAPLAAGRYRLQAETELQDRSLQSDPMEITVSKVSVELQRVVQQNRVLETIAKRTGGRYSPGSVPARFLDNIPVNPRTRNTVTELSLRSDGMVFGVILLLLAVEWVIRKRIGMI